MAAINNGNKFKVLAIKTYDECWNTSATNNGKICNIKNLFDFMQINTDGRMTEQNRGIFLSILGIDLNSWP